MKKLLLFLFLIPLFASSQQVDLIRQGKISGGTGKAVIVSDGTTIDTIKAGTSGQSLLWNGTNLYFGSPTISIDTTDIPNFYLKVRSLLSANAPISYNSTTGKISADTSTANTGLATLYQVERKVSISDTASMLTNYVRTATLNAKKEYVTLPVGCASFAAPAQNQTYYFANIPSRAPQTTITRDQLICPLSGTITAVYLWATWGNTPTGNSHTFNVRINNTTDVLITNSATISGAGPVTVSATGLSQAVTAGDLLAIKWTTATTWATPATNIIWTGFIVIDTTIH